MAAQSFKTLSPFLLSPIRSRKLLRSVVLSPNTSLRLSHSVPNCSPEELPCASTSTSKSELKPGLYLVSTPIGNLEDITFRALRVLKSADVILSEDTRHSSKLLHHYNIKTPLVSYHKFNEREREASILRRLREGEIVALISDAGTPGISDPGTELVKVCASENIVVTPVPGPSALVAALSASGLPTNEFTFVGFLPKRTSSRRERLQLSSKEAATQIFYVPPHGIHDFLSEASSVFGDSRSCVIAREITKIHEEFWRGTLGEAKEHFLNLRPKGEITLLIGGNQDLGEDTPSETVLELELEKLISGGHCLSSVSPRRVRTCFTAQSPASQIHPLPRLVLLLLGNELLELLVLTRLMLLPLKEELLELLALARLMLPLLWEKMVELMMLTCSPMTMLT